MRFLWDNEFDNYSLHTFLEHSSYPVENLQDYQLAKKWRTPTFVDKIDRGDCESATPPMIFDETVPLLTNTTFARDIAEAHGDTYSYKVTKTIASGTWAHVTLTDNENTNDMHGTVAGHTYTWFKWVKVPLASGIALDEIILRISDYDSAWAYTDGPSPTAFDTWQRISVTRMIRVGATGVHLRISMHANAEDTEYFYVDDIEIYDVPQIKIDAGSNNVISAKSFAIGGHNLTGGAKITIEGNDASDFDDPDHSDELIRNLIIDSENLTTDEWNIYQASSDLTNMYVKNKRLTKGILTGADTGAQIYQIQYPNNTTQSFQAILRKGSALINDLKYRRNTDPYTSRGTIRITWATKAITSSDGLTNLDYEWIDDETVWVAGTANSIDISLLHRLSVFLSPTEATIGKYVYATAMMVTDSATVTKYDEIHAALRTHVFSEKSYRYWQILIEDFDNVDGYSEAGRMHFGDYLQTDTAGKDFSILYDDTSSVDESLTGQSFGDERIIRKIINLKFPYWTDALRKNIVTMITDIKKVKPIVLVLDENDQTSVVPVYARLNDNMSINHIIGYNFNGVLSFKEVF